MRWLRFFSRHPRPWSEEPNSRSFTLSTGSLDPRDKPEGDGKGERGKKEERCAKGGLPRLSDILRPGGKGIAAAGME